jgi:hypothetical protein
MGKAADLFVILAAAELFVVLFVALGLLVRWSG